MRITTKLNQRGDTIIEVLIVLAILGFAFAISMATATEGLKDARNSEEHSRALGTENAQMELLRLAVSEKTPLPSSGAFCMDENARPVTGFPPGYSGTSSVNDLTPFPSQCVTDGLYVSSIHNDGSGNYTVRVRWVGNGNTGTQQELMTYRTHPLTVDATHDTPVGSTPTKVNVIVRSIPLKDGDIRTDRTPSCADAATGVKGGSGITLRNATTGATHGTGVTSNFSSSVEFSNISPYHSYNATLTSTPSDDWKPCKGTSAITLPNTGPTKQALPDTTTTFNEFKIYPQCKKVTVRDPDTPIYGPWYNVGGQPIYHWGHYEPIYGPYYWVQGGRRADLDFYANSGYNNTFNNYPLPGAIGPEDGKSPHKHLAVPSGSGVKYFGGYIASGHHSGKGYYAVWDAYQQRDIIGWSNHEGHIVGYTPDDWRRDIIGYQENYHDEYPCPS